MDVLTDVKVSRPKRFVAMALGATTRAAKKKARREAEAIRKNDRYMNEIMASMAEGVPLLSFAAKNGHAYLLQLLIEIVRFDPNSTQLDVNGRTCLHHAAQGGQLGIVKELIEKYNVNMNTQDGMQSTALHLSVYHGQSDVLSQLLDYGARFGEINFYGREIHAAAFMGNFSAVAIIHEKFSNEVNIVLDGFCTPLVCALYGESKQCEELIVQFSTVDMAVMYKVLSYKTSEVDALKTIEVLFSHGGNPNLYDQQWYECPALIVAAKKKWLQILRFLLDRTDVIPGVPWTETGILTYVESKEFIEMDINRTQAKVQPLRGLIIENLRAKNLMTACLICKALRYDMASEEWEKYDSLCQFFCFFAITFSEGIDLIVKDISDYTYGLVDHGQFDMALKGAKGCLLLEPNNRKHQHLHQAILNEIAKQSTSH